MPAQPQSPEERRKAGIKAFARYSGLAFQLLGACLAGVFIGNWLDAKMQLESSFWAVFLTIFFMTGSLYVLYRQLK